MQIIQSFKNVLEKFRLHKHSKNLYTFQIFMRRLYVLKIKAKQLFNIPHAFHNRIRKTTSEN